MKMPTREQVEAIRKNKDLAPDVAELFRDNDRMNAILGQMRRQRAELDTRIAEVVGICNYTMSKAVERHERAQKKAAEPPPASDADRNDEIDDAVAGKAIEREIASAAQEAGTKPDA